MSLLVIDPGLRLWGSERALLATLGALVEANGPIVLLVPIGAEIVGQVRDPMIRVVERDIGLLHRRSRLARLRFMAGLATVCRAQGITRIYLNQGGLCRLVRPVARLLGLAFVNHVRLREDIARAARLKGTRRSPVTSILISRAMHALWPGPDRPDPHTGRVVAYDVYELAPRPAGDVADRRGDAMACVGRLAPLKGQEVLIRALGIARRRGVDCAVRLVGADPSGGSYQQVLLALAAAERVADLVEFLGYSEDPSAEFRRARFAPVPSHYEPLGRVILEAWDHGAVPIVCATSGGGAEIVAASGGGLIYCEDTPEALAQALQAAASMSETDRLALVARGREWVALNLTLTNYRHAVGRALFPPDRCA